MGGYVIHTPTDLSAKDRALAVDYGPSQVTAPSSYEEMLVESGFSGVERLDVTDIFLKTCQSLFRARVNLEDDLRKEEGDDVFEEEQQKKLNMAKGIEMGLLRRSLLIAIKI